MSNTGLIPRTVHALEAKGYTAERVEQYNAFTKRKHDLFGFADILCVRAEPPCVLLVQVTDMAHHTEHIAKIQAEKRAQVCKGAGVRIELWTWRKLLVKKGGKARRWEPLVEEL